MPGYRRIGESGLRVSDICMGTMTFGLHERPGNCTEEQSHAILNRYVELGGNFIDTADVYSSGQSEKFIGSWLHSGPQVKREQLVIATKARMGEGRQGPLNGACLSRKHLVSQLEQSLESLKTPYVDIYQWHCWDKFTPLEESLRTMNDLVRSGKVLYFGVSNLCGWQLQKVVDSCKYMGLANCISLQQQYSLLNREAELDVLDVCQNEGLGVLTWSPLKGGWLTGKFQRGMTAPLEGTRVHFATKNKMINQSHPTWDAYYKSDKIWGLLDAMKSIAQSHNRTVPQVAIKWVLKQVGVSSVIIGAKTISQLEDNMAAADSTWDLSPHDMVTLDSHSQYDIPYPYEMINRINVVKMP